MCIRDRWKGPQTKEAIIEIVKAGKGAMPAYSKEISSEAELESLAQHVLTLSSGAKK
jgi:mono/diheme cytochrome c family protein